jgi:cell wall-associated NlpC family hydrolase
VSVEGLVQHVEQVLARGHALFGWPSVAGGQLGEGQWGLASAGECLASVRAQMSGLAGGLPTHYGRWAVDAVRFVDAATDADIAVRDRVRAAGHADYSGGVASAAVLDRAAIDATGLAPMGHSAAGRRALIAALRTRLVQQQRLINAYRARDVQLAAVLRSLRYSRRPAIGAMPLGATAFGGRGYGGSPLPLLSGLSGLAGGGGAGRNRLAAVADWRGDPGAAGVEPGMNAAKAALSKRGCPYVWGAKGPGHFDCSGLTQWAWRQAGVMLGADTYAQIRDGIAVPAGQVRPGDLIFPLDSFGRAGPGHVQLAISDHQVVHAPTPGDVVRIATMPARYIARRPMRTPLV